MDIRLVRTAVKQISKADTKRDYEKATMLEWELWKAALQEIAGGGAGEVLAQEVLRTLILTFPRQGPVKLNNGLF